ncbi:hypothetical protein PNW85_19995, partial [[Ruminococcus] gnavus]
KTPFFFRITQGVENKNNFSGLSGLGIRDKRLLCIISKILKSEIEGEGVSEKGTPQGGLIVDQHIIICHFQKNK